MICVTTRFRLRRPWQMLWMYWSFRRMQRDLAAAHESHGLLRHAFLMESPTVFVTLSIWESQEALDRFANVSSHVAAVRGAKGVCRDIWSAYWRLDAMSAYATAWSGGADWPVLVPDSQQPWHLVEPSVADAAQQLAHDIYGEDEETIPVAAPASDRLWDRRGVERGGTSGEKL